jgi:hypothetical protein
MMMRGTISPAARLVDVLRTEKSIRQIFNEIVGLSIRERGKRREDTAWFLRQFGSQRVFAPAPSSRFHPVCEELFWEAQTGADMMIGGQLFGMLQD